MCELFNVRSDFVRFVSVHPGAVSLKPWPRLEQPGSEFREVPDCGSPLPLFSGKSRRGKARSGHEKSHGGHSFLNCQSGFRNSMAAKGLKRRKNLIPLAPSAPFCGYIIF